MRFADTLVLFIIGLVLFSPLALAATLTVVPNKTTYVPNDKLVVTGTASPSSTVTIKVIKPNNNILGIDQASTSAAGAYNITVLTWPTTNSTATPFGNYTIAVTDVFSGATAQKIVTFAGNATKITTTNSTTSTNVQNTTITVTRNSTVTVTRNTTVTTTTTSLSSTTVTSTTTSVTTTTVPTTTVSTVVSTSTATTTSTAVSTVTSTIPGTVTTKTVTSEVSTGLPAEVTYAAIGIAVIAIIAAALLATRRRRV